MKQNSREYWLIAMAWMLVYATMALYVWYAGVDNGFGFRWEGVYESWTLVTAYLILYVVHHFVLVPRLFLRKRYATYAATITVCISLFMVLLISYHPKPFMPMHKKGGKEMRMHHERRMKGEIMRPHHKRMLAPPDVARLVIALMMIGVDLGSIAWINSQKLRQRLLLLEKQNLKQELEHLRYQINPHFFMNTLNNIHVLVDVDQERAKRAIIELSGLMRHSLYNGSESLTPLQNEIDFLRQYISLMQLRFGNRVELTTDLPDAISHSIMIPPLLFATFVENAFKHGISYQERSYIDISVAVDNANDMIRFRCDNSRSDVSSAVNDNYHGIGLNNVRKRLDLQFGDRYSLEIDDSQPKRFVVELILPILTNKTTV